jgi:uncharacterized membrane protein
MAAILTNLHRTIAAGFVLALVVLIIMGLVTSGYSLKFDQGFWLFVVRWLHVLSGIMWIGMLYYFNFVQMPSMPKIPDEQKPAVSKVIAPTALFWFRWAAMATIIFGILLALLSRYFVDAVLLGITSGGGANTMIGIGMWLGTIMWFNVWFIIWPNQKKALGIVTVPPDEKAKAARTAMLFSRTNVMLSIPMLYCMIAKQNVY